MDAALAALYFAAPGMIANAMPVVFRNRLGFLAKPVDFKKTFRGRRIFGDHKTFRGYTVAVIAAILLVYLQRVLYGFEFWRGISFVDYSSVNAALLGFLLGFGAMFADSAKSFFKRQLDRKPGERWIPWDQIDYVIGIILLSSIVRPMTLPMIMSLLIIGPVLSILTTKTGYLLKIRNEKW